MEENPTDQVWNFEENSDFFHQELRSLEFRAYGSVLTALRAGGELDEERRNVLAMMRQILSISETRHKCEVRRVATNPRLTMIANKIHGYNTTQVWIDEGFCDMPAPAALPRFPCGVQNESNTMKESAAVEQSRSGEKIVKMKPSIRDFRKAQKVEKSFSSMLLNGWVSSDNEQASPTKMKAKVRVTTSGLKRTSRVETAVSSSETDSDDEISYSDLRRQGRIKAATVPAKPEENLKLMTAAKMRKVLQKKKAGLGCSPDMAEPGNVLTPIKVKEEFEMNWEASQSKRPRYVGPKQKHRFVNTAMSYLNQHATGRGELANNIIQQTEIKTEDPVTPSEFGNSNNDVYQKRYHQGGPIREGQTYREFNQGHQRRPRGSGGRGRGGRGSSTSSARGAAGRSPTKAKQDLGAPQQKLQHSKRKQLDEVRVELQSDGESDKEDSRDCNNARSNFVGQNGMLHREYAPMMHQPRFDRQPDYNFSPRFEQTFVPSSSFKTTAERDAAAVLTRLADLRNPFIEPTKQGQVLETNPPPIAASYVATSPSKTEFSKSDRDRSREGSEKSEDDSEKSFQDRLQLTKTDSMSCSSGDESGKVKTTAPTTPKTQVRTNFPAPVFSTSLNLTSYNKKRAKVLELETTSPSVSNASPIASVSNVTSTASSLARRPPVLSGPSTITSKAPTILPQRKAQPHILANSKVQRVLNAPVSSTSSVTVNVPSTFTSASSSSAAGVTVQNVQLLSSGPTAQPPNSLTSTPIVASVASTTKPSSYNIPITSIQNLSSFNMAGQVSYGAVKSSQGPNIIFLQKTGVGSNTSPSSPLSNLAIPSSGSNVFNTVNVQQGKNSRAVILRRANIPRQKNQKMNPGQVPQLLQTARILNSPAEIALIANLQSNTINSASGIRKVVSGTQIQQVTSVSSPSPNASTSAPVTPMLTTSSTPAKAPTPECSLSSQEITISRNFSYSSQAPKSPPLEKLATDSGETKIVPSRTVVTPVSGDFRPIPLEGAALPAGDSQDIGLANSEKDKDDQSSNQQDHVAETIDEFLGALLGTVTQSSEEGKGNKDLAQPKKEIINNEPLDTGANQEQLYVDSSSPNCCLNSEVGDNHPCDSASGSLEVESTILQQNTPEVEQYELKQHEEAPNSKTNDLRGCVAENAIEVSDLHASQHLFHCDTVDEVQHEACSGATEVGEMIDIAMHEEVASANFEDQSHTEYNNHGMHPLLDFSGDEQYLQEVASSRPGSSVAQEVQLSEDIFAKALESSGLDFTAAGFDPSGVTIEVDGSVVDPQDVAVELEISADDA